MTTAITAEYLETFDLFQAQISIYPSIKWGETGVFIQNII